MTSSQSAPLLSLRNITKQYPSVIANDSINLDVRSGSIHAVLGENGAGKSTLMKLAYGVIEPDAGDILWQGKTVDLRSTASARKLGIGMVFQHFSLFETLSVVENISLTIPGSRKTLAKRISELGANYELDVDPDASVHSLSVGERQRVEIIRCLMQDLKLLILDEPTSVLPPQHVRSLFDALRKLRDNNVAILFISHKLEEIRELCDTATILRGGRVTGTVNPNEKTAHELATLMIGHDIPRVEAREHQQQHDDPTLELSDLSVSSTDPFGTDLNNLNLQVFGGEIVGIAGVSGNGQKELSRLLSGEHVDARLPAAAITMTGQPAAALGAIERRRLGFSFVPEERLGRGAVPPMELAKNSLLTAFDKGMHKRGFLRKDRMHEFTSQCIEDFDVRCGGTSATANSLSGGNLQKFIVGRELMLKPKFLFLSQPTWGVDIGAATAIRQRLLDLRDSGVAILVISEELEELFEITDRIYVINSGSLSPSLTTAEVTPNDIGKYMIGNLDTKPNQPGGQHAAET
ncbi:MAG: ABC transporter ATP-binding protein [Granulosicoccus sp.]|nr:ABC transporter ATP-binding protein [Granulosicoccus sp.]